MADARFVKLEGFEQPCLLVCPDGAMPEELGVEFPVAEGEVGKRGPVVYRLQPSSAAETRPIYMQVFDE
jgi:hypothetical protein